MKLFRSIDSIIVPEHGTALTIGNFDALHKGHQVIIAKLVERARSLGVPAVLMTFMPSPENYFLGEHAHPRLHGLTERSHVLEQLGLDMLLAQPFNEALAITTAHEFIDKFIRQRLRVRYLVVGDDFRFGANRTGDFAMLARYADFCRYEVERVNTVELDGERISSTLVRRKLSQGDLESVRVMLGRRFGIAGRVCHGEKRARQWGFPTLNLPQSHTPPMTGVFAVTVRRNDGSKFPGVANLGNRPTVDGMKTLLEVHLFDFSGSIYGERMCVEFVSKIRDERKFASFANLQSQIRRDCVEARSILGLQPHS